MKSIYLFVGLGLLSLNIGFAQKVTVVESSETVDNVARSGMYTVINLDGKQVEKSWERHLKTFGKLNSSKGYFILPAATLSDVSSKPASVYSKMFSTPEGAKVWWAIDLGDGYASNSSNHAAYKAAEKKLHDFAVDCYVEDINEQVKDAEKAYAASVKNQEKEVRHGEQLAKNVTHNQDEKARLEGLLRQNAQELEQLKKDIELNKKAQADGLVQNGKMKDAIEVVKGKLSHVQ